MFHRAENRIENSPMRTRQYDKWHVACTEPVQEKVAAHWIRTLTGLDVLAPSCTTEIVRQGRMVWRLAPLFPGYVFVRFDIEDDWWQVRRQPHVTGILLQDGWPAMVPDEAMERLFRYIDEDDVCNLKVAMQEGDPIRVTGGMWEGYTGLFQRSARDRVTALLSIFGRQTRVELRRVDVEAIEPV